VTLLDQRLEDLRDLIGQLTSRNEDQAAGTLGTRFAEPLDHWKAKSQGLAGSRLRPARDIRAGQTVGNRQNLDAERGDNAIFRQDVDEVLIDPKVEEVGFS
jgi:hypothetical protein